MDDNLNNIGITIIFLKNTIHKYSIIELPNLIQPNPTIGWYHSPLKNPTTPPPPPQNTGCDYIFSHFQATQEADFWNETLF